MNCKSVVGVLSEYLDRELSPADRDAVRIHLAQCDHCRAEERELRALKGLLLGVRAPEPPEELEARLFARLRQEATIPVRPRFELTFLRPHLAGYGGLVAAAALAAVVLVGAPKPSREVVHLPENQSPVASVARQDFPAEIGREMDNAYVGGDDLSNGAPLIVPVSNDR